MTQALATAIETATADVRAVADLAERYFAARDTRTQLLDGDRELKAIQQEVAQTLKEGRTWAEVGAILQVSGSRAEALAKGR